MLAAVASDEVGDAGVRVDLLRGVSGPITMLRLDIAPGAPKLPVADGPRTGFYVLDDLGQLTGELLLWIEEGEPSTLECAWYTEEPPAALPEPRRVVIKATLADEHERKGRRLDEEVKRALPSDSITLEYWETARHDSS